MAGLALGTAIAATSELRRIRPLRFYALLELVVAVLGCTIVFALPRLGELLRPVFQTLWEYQPALTGLRFFLSFVILLLPSTAMGLTLPVILEDPGLRTYDFGRAVGLLYGCNTLGAVVGALVGEACLVKLIGLLGTSFAAALMSCIAASAAFFITKGDLIEALPTRQHWLRFDVNYRLPWGLLLLSFGAGGILLCLEVVWFRFLHLYVASSSIAFCVMLAVVLAGIGSGGVVAGALSSRVLRSTEMISILFILAAISTLLCYWFFPIPALKQNELAFFVESWREIGLISAALMFPVAFLSGVLFPTIAARVQEAVKNRMNSTGITILFNTAGAAVGPLLAGFVLLPKCGFQLSLIFCAAGYALLGLLFMPQMNWHLNRVVHASILGLVALLILIFAIFPYHRDEVHFANARRVYESEGQHLVRKIEGTTNTWQLLRRDLFGEPYYYRLLADGFSMSATNPRIQRYMRLFAYLPLTLRPNAEDALLIAFGCGVTADALTHDGDLKHIDIVDISKEVFDLADDYHVADYSNPLRDRRVSAMVQDGRFFLQAAPRHYDVITGEPPPPKVAGAVNLYTEEFFSLMSSRLKEGGMATFWLPIYQLNLDEVKAILRAFHNAFPNASVWGSADEEWIMMGIKGIGAKLHREDINRLWRNAAARADLARIGIEVPEQLAALFLMDDRQIDDVCAGAKPLTDFYPKRLGDVVPDEWSLDDFASIYMEASAAAQRFRSSPLMEKIWPESVQRSLDGLLLVRETRFRSGIRPTNWLAELDFYLRGSRLRSPVLEVFRSNEFQLAIAQRVASQSKIPPAETLPDLVAGALARRDIGGAIQLLESERDQHQSNLDHLYLLIYLYCLNNSVEKAEALAATNAGLIPKDSFVHWLWGKLQAEFGFRPPQE